MPIESKPAGGTAISMMRLFQGVEDPVRDFILGATASIDLKKGQRLFERGDPGGIMYIVLSGRIEISVLTEAGRKIALNVIEAGNCFGEISMFDRRDRTASAVALEATRLQPIAHDTFISASNRNPALALTLIAILCERVRWISDSVEDYALLSLEQRLARRLVMLQQKFAAEDGSIHIAQSDLADFVGSTRESTNKILMNWKNLELIEIGRRSIKVRDQSRLDQIAHEGSI